MMKFVVINGRVYEVGTWDCENSYGTNHCGCCDPGDMVGSWDVQGETFDTREAAEKSLRPIVDKQTIELAMEHLGGTAEQRAYADLPPELAEELEAGDREIAQFRAVSDEILTSRSKG